MICWNLHFRSNELNRGKPVRHVHIALIKTKFGSASIVVHLVYIYENALRLYVCFCSGE